jgi:hypothetical protein
VEPTRRGSTVLLLFREDAPLPYAGITRIRFEGSSRWLRNSQ